MSDLDQESIESIQKKKELLDKYNDDIASDPTGDDIGTMIVDINNEIKYKLAFLLFIVYIIINTDIFNENILSKFSNTLNEKNEVTGQGIVVCAGVLAFVYIILDFIMARLAI